MNTFTSQELDLLIEAVGAWERGKCGHDGSPLGSPLGALLGGAGFAIPQCDDPDCDNCKRLRSEFDRMITQRRDEAKLASERSILLRAKLIGLRDGLAADKVFDEAQAAKK